MFTKSAAFYDAIYHFKDYKAESDRLHALIQQHKCSDGNTLLDVACGTGAHDVYLREWYQIEGIDLDEQLLKVAAERLPGLTFHHGDMRGFDLGKKFDVIMCLFSSIGYVKTIEGVQQTAQNFANNLKPGGVMLVEPWFPPGFLKPGHVSIHTGETPEMKVARMSRTEILDRVSVLNFHYMVGTASGVEYFTERHELGLFTREEYTGAFRDAGLDVTYDEQGLMGRGLYIGLKPVG